MVQVCGVERQLLHRIGLVYKIQDCERDGHKGQADDLSVKGSWWSYLLPLLRLS